MNKIFRENKLCAALVACLLIGAITMSFQNTPFGPIDKLDTLTDLQDTIPVNTEDKEAKMSISDFDKLIQNMDNKSLKMQAEISKIDFDNIHKEITASLNKVDFEKIKLDIDRAMKEIDFAKIEQGVKTALKEIEWNKLNNDVKLSLQDAKREIEKINMEVIKKEMEKAKQEIEKSRNEIKKINIDELMKNANSGIAKAKAELRLTKEMFNEMEKDGLINQKEGFTIEYKDKTLLINGKKQTEAIKEKYRQYIKGDTFKISISKE
ncbi:MAG: hypothetical protein JWP81_1672 [Ferruginibacter sp.]|nr:hypothetical protein [Ferruginibacter sp.]